MLQLSNTLPAAVELCSLVVEDRVGIDLGTSWAKTPSSIGVDLRARLDAVKRLLLSQAESEGPLLLSIGDGLSYRRFTENDGRPKSIQCELWSGPTGVGAAHRSRYWFAALQVMNSLRTPVDHIPRLEITLVPKATKETILPMLPGLERTMTLFGAYVDELETGEDTAPVFLKVEFSDRFLVERGLGLSPMIQATLPCFHPDQVHLLEGIDGLGEVASFDFERWKHVADWLASRKHVNALVAGAEHVPLLLDRMRLQALLDALAPRLDQIDADTYWAMHIYLDSADSEARVEAPQTIHFPLSTVCSAAEIGVAVDAFFDRFFP